MINLLTLLTCAALVLSACCTLMLVGVLRRLRRLAGALAKTSGQRQTRTPLGADQGAQALLREDPAGTRLLGRLARFQSERFAPPMREQKR